ncbi:82e41ef0-f825-407f-bd56-5ffecb5f7ca9 [Thermothielavioides terrestris]|uniref:82e41ef0-f825-407f-bd56-5ffecb5f7ca9 n=1 Tax=Thermothielavioides terrestris TaxID=2587410 RepID=A0A3S4C773_9PEZI|nr:82e41ef0-f825-407f-bd56-5ffecb5f7ca9 [Thermothielavioides terrestris]
MASSRQAAASGASASASATAVAGFVLPLPYRLFFLLVEPIATLAGAYYAFFDQRTYLDLTHAASAPSPVPLGTSIAMSQLANLYLAFALSEALVLRSTADLRVWRTLLFCLLVADFGHLYTVRALGPQIYWRVSEWNAIDWGNIGFVYLGASMRAAFLAGVGFGARKKVKKAA